MIFVSNLYSPELMVRGERGPALRISPLLAGALVQSDITAIGREGIPVALSG